MSLLSSESSRSSGGGFGLIGSGGGFPDGFSFIQFGPGVGGSSLGKVGRFLHGSGSSSSIGVTASFGMIPSVISSLGMLIGPDEGVLAIRGATVLSGAFLSS